MKKLLFIFALILVSCKSDEETRIFTVTTNAIPLEGGTVTLETTQETTGEYKWGDVVNIKALPSTGYEFEKFTGNYVYIGDPDTLANGRHGYASVSMSCPDPTFCEYDIVLNGHFVKKD